MSAQKIAADYVTDLHARIEQGEKPRKINELSSKEFIRQMLPHVQKFLAQGYTYKEIAVFLGHISAGDLKKAVAKEDPTPAMGNKSKAGLTANALTTRIPCKQCKGRKTLQPSA